MPRVKTLIIRQYFEKKTSKEKKSSVCQLSLNHEDIDDEGENAICGKANISSYFTF